MTTSVNSLAAAPPIILQVQDAFADMAQDLVELLPKITIALVILVIGIVAAKIVRGFLAKTFKTINLDALLNRAGIGELFAKIGLGSASIFIPKIIYFFVVLIVIRVAADAAGIDDVTEIINRIIAFLPAAITAAIIMLVGFIVADLIQNAVFRALDAMGLEYANTLAKVISGFVFILALTVALPQLGIETELLNDSVKIVLAGIALAIALALGLGLKTPAHNVVSGVYARDLYKIGTTISYDGTEAKVAGVGPLTTKLQVADGSFIIIPNSTLVSTTIKGRSAE